MPLSDYARSMTDATRRVKSPFDAYQLVKVGLLRGTLIPDIRGNATDFQCRMKNMNQFRFKGHASPPLSMHEHLVFVAPFQHSTLRPPYPTSTLRPKTLPPPPPPTPHSPLVPTSQPTSSQQNLSKYPLPPPCRAPLEDLPPLTRERPQRENPPPPSRSNTPHLPSQPGGITLWTPA